MISQVRNNQKNQSPKRISQAFVVGIVVLISMSALVWILNSEGIIQGAWSTIFNIIFIVFSVILGVLQWHAQISSGRTTPSPSLSVLRYHATSNKAGRETKLELGDDKVVFLIYSDGYLCVYIICADVR